MQYILHDEPKGIYYLTTERINSELIGRRTGAGFLHGFPVLQSGNYRGNIKRVETENFGGLLYTLTDAVVLAKYPGKPKNMDYVMMMCEGKQTQKDLIDLFCELDNAGSLP